MDLTELQAKVAATTGVIASAVAFITGLKQRLDDIIEGDNHEDELKTLVDELDAAEDSLAAAIATDPVPVEQVFTA
jgi:hypothetical protein